LLLWMIRVKEISLRIFFEEVIWMSVPSMEKDK